MLQICSLYFLSQEEQRKDESVGKMEGRSVVCTENLNAACSEGSAYGAVEQGGTCTEKLGTTYTETFYEGIPARDVRYVIYHENQSKLPEGQFALEIFLLMI